MYVPVESTRNVDDGCPAHTTAGPTTEMAKSATQTFMAGPPFIL